MTDRQAGPSAAYGHWLRLRAKVRALATSLVAAEYGLRRDARRCDDPAMTTLVRQLAAERRALEALGSELDARIAGVKRDCAALDAGRREAVAAAARRRRGLGGHGNPPPPTNAGRGG
jgi:hypothetical protein